MFDASSTWESLGKMVYVFKLVTTDSWPVHGSIGKKLLIDGSSSISMVLWMQEISIHFFFVLQKAITSHQ
jgi:hypothetical protein